MNKQNKGILFRNIQKKTDKHPDYQGSVNIEGKEYYLSAWVSDNSDKNGNKWLNLSFGGVVEKQNEKKIPVSNYNPDLVPDKAGDDLPF